MTSSYLLKYHDFYFNRISTLKKQIKELKSKFPPERYLQHEIVKLAARIRNAELVIIPEDPNKPEYQLKGELKKFSNGLGTLMNN